MKCQKCESERVMALNTKCNDMCFVTLNDKEQNGYVPSDMSIGGGDYLKFKLCLDCGQIQGKFPLETTELEQD